MDQNTLLDAQQVMKLMSFKRNSLTTYVKTGVFPSPVKIGTKTIRWRYRDISDWVDKLVDK